MIYSSCNAENAVDNLPPLDFAESNELVKTALARRGFTYALPTDVAPCKTNPEDKWKASLPHFEQHEANCRWLQESIWVDNGKL